MKIKQKWRFDLDELLRSSGVGKTTVTYQPTEVIFSQGQAADSVMYIQNGAIKLSVLSHAGKEAVVAMTGRLLRRTGADGSSHSPEDRDRDDRDHRADRPETADESPSSRSARPLGPVYCAHAGSEHSHRRRPRRSTVQFLREAAGPRTASAGALRQTRPDASRVAADLSGDTRRDGRYYALACELLHEQVQEAWVHRVQRRPQGQSFPPDRYPARLTQPSWPSD